MKKYLLATAALITLGAPALAADLSPRTYTKAPAYVAPAPIYNWTGFYIGGHIGGTFSGGNSDYVGGGSDGKFLGGVQGGFDYQFANNWVFGLEGQYSWSDNSNTWNNLGFYRTQDGLGSATARLGYTWGPALLYVKGGFGFADYSFNFDNGRAGGVFTTNGGSKNGYTVGAGLEYLFAQNWSGKIEYQYYDFGSTDIFQGGNLIANVKHDQHVVKAGLNYRFNLGGGY